MIGNINIDLYFKFKHFIYKNRLGGKGCAPHIPSRGRMILRHFLMLFSLTIFKVTFGFLQNCICQLAARKRRRRRESEGEEGGWGRRLADSGRTRIMAFTEGPAARLMHRQCKHAAGQQHRRRYLQNGGLLWVLKDTCSPTWHHWTTLSGRH